MKARVIENGKIIDVDYEFNPMDGSSSYFDTRTKKCYSPMEIDLGTVTYSNKNINKDIDWDDVQSNVISSIIIDRLGHSRTPCFDSIEDCEYWIKSAKSYIETLKNKYH